MQRLTEREGVAGIALLAMFADGLIRPEEDDVLRERLASHALFSGLDDAQLGEMLERVEKVSRELGPDAFLRACCARLEGEAVDAAFAIAQEIVEADEEVAAEENDLLTRLDELLADR